MPELTLDRILASEWVIVILPEGKIFFKAKNDAAMKAAESAWQVTVARGFLALLEARSASQPTAADVMSGIKK